MVISILSSKPFPQILRNFRPNSAQTDNLVDPAPLKEDALEEAYIIVTVDRKGVVRTSSDPLLTRLVTSEWLLVVFNVCHFL